MTSPFIVEGCTAGRAARLVLAGELDSSGVPELEAMFRAVGATRGLSNVVVDVRALDFCDSAGWHALERCRNEGAMLSGNPACLRRLFYLIRHSHKLPPDLHELRGLQPGAAERIPDLLEDAG
jgi:anti-anti-sigma regulatory factor